MFITRKTFIYTQRHIRHRPPIARSPNSLGPEVPPRPPLECEVAWCRPTPPLSVRVYIPLTRPEPFNFEPVLLWIHLLFPDLPALITVLTTIRAFAAHTGTLARECCEPQSSGAPQISWYRFSSCSSQLSSRDHQSFPDHSRRQLGG